MYCLQRLLPLLLIPKRLVHPSFLFYEAIIVWIYTISFILERKPCASCLIIFITAVAIFCYLDPDGCALWPSCETVLNGEMCKYVFDSIKSKELKA
uniref:Bladder cancer-associated protein n=1 Tax=Panagrolaimus sp. JU765 TaxID=591449 RepID=A0AC34RJE8_9BILA